jgi:plastocyanin
LAATVAACGGGGGSTSSTTSTPAAPPPGAAKVDPATAGDVTGTVNFEGTAPKNEPIKMAADPNCAKNATGPQFQETYVVGSDGKTLGNVLVYVKDGLGNYVYDAPSGTVTIDQKGCRYIPHVLGIRVGQKIEIINSDPTLHNIHATPKTNSEFNTGQPMQGMKTEHVFDKKEATVVVPFKCDVHGWMNASAGVFDHPYFAITKDDGKFTLKGLPPGTYTVEAWHERLGATTQSVTLGAKETKDVSFTFKAPAAAAN